MDVDIMMPEMDRLETRCATLALEDGRSDPIIAVAAVTRGLGRCRKADAWNYLPKPIDRAQLLTTLRAWLYR